MQDLRLESVREFIQAFAHEIGEKESELFEEMGMFLHSSLARWDYFCTPINSMTFASTGGDGVHYSFLNLDNSSIKPVVMTVPMADRHNIILGESLSEFMRLGARYGYFSLEQLAYDRQETINELNDSFLRNTAEMEEKVLVNLIKEFDLTPWENVSVRLDELERHYSAQIILPDFDEWQARNKIV